MRIMIEILCIVVLIVATTLLFYELLREEQHPPDRAPVPIDLYTIDSLRQEVAKLQATAGRNDSAIRMMMMCYWNAHPRHRSFLLPFVRAYFGDERQGSRMTIHQEFDLGEEKP